jgi:SAM-dependent methyltransferase
MIDEEPSGDTWLEIRLAEKVTDKESQAQYDAIYDYVDISQNDSFYRWLYDLIDLQEGEIYLDIASGQSQLVTMAQSGGIVSVGSDLSIQALRRAQKDRDAKNLAVVNSKELPFAAESVTAVSNIGSLEHFIDMDAAVREKARVLKAGGRAMILVPNTFSLLNNIWFALRKGKTSVDPYQPIQRYGARYEWQELLETNGLKVMKTVKYDRVRPRTWSDFKALIRQPKEVLRLLLAPLVPMNLAFCFVFICTKRDDEYGK